MAPPTMVGGLGSRFAHDTARRTELNPRRATVEYSSAEGAIQPGQPVAAIDTFAGYPEPGAMLRLPTPRRRTFFPVASTKARPCVCRGPTMRGARRCRIWEGSWVHAAAISARGRASAA